MGRLEIVKHEESLVVSQPSWRGLSSLGTISYQDHLQKREPCRFMPDPGIPDTAMRSRWDSGIC